MSTAPSPVPTTAAATNTDNQFTLHDPSNHTQVTYLPHRGGPIIQGTTPGGASLTYKGTEGSFNFTDDQITTETTAIGSLVTVTLNVVPDLRRLTFSVLMPSVTSGPIGSSKSFETLAIKATQHLTLIGPAPTGANPTYVEIKMHGTAKSVEIAD